MKFFRKRQPRHRATPQQREEVMDWITDPALSSQHVQQRIDALFSDLRLKPGPVYVYTGKYPPVVVPAALVEQEDASILTPIVPTEVLSKIIVGRKDLSRLTAKEMK